MAKYTFKRELPGGETEMRDFEIPISRYRSEATKLESQDWVRVLIPVAVKDSGSGRD